MPFTVVFGESTDKDCPPLPVWEESCVASLPPLPGSLTVSRRIMGPLTTRYLDLVQSPDHRWPQVCQTPFCLAGLTSQRFPASSCPWVVALSSVKVTGPRAGSSAAKMNLSGPRCCIVKWKGQRGREEAERAECSFSDMREHFPYLFSYQRDIRNTLLDLYFPVCRAREANKNHTDLLPWEALQSLLAAFCFLPDNLPVIRYVRFYSNVSQARMGLFV